MRIFVFILVFLLFSCRPVEKIEVPPEEPILELTPEEELWFGDGSTLEDTDAWKEIEWLIHFDGALPVRYRGYEAVEAFIEGTGVIILQRWETVSLDEETGRPSTILTYVVKELNEFLRYLLKDVEEFISIERR